MSTPLSQLGEDATLKRLLHQPVTNDSLLIGPGDDCAVVKGDNQWDILLKTDVVIEGVHFAPQTAPELIGHKALARAVSDIAAMGGLPEHALITLLVHPGRPVELLEGIYRGLNTLAADFGISLAGGETSSLPRDGLVINVALTGRVEAGQAILRSGGQSGDIICVSGQLGGSFASGRHLSFLPRVGLARWLIAQGIRPTAMMDLSDGLGSDLPRLAAASHCGYHVFLSTLPLHDHVDIPHAISEGEDYELLFTLSTADAEHLRSLNPPTPITPIGHLTAGAVTPLKSGWQHFSHQPVF